MKFIRFFTCLLLLSHNTFDSLSVAEFEEKKSNLKIRTHTSSALPVGWALKITLLSRIKNPPLFCLPPLLRLTIVDYKEIIALGIKDIPVNRLNHEVMDINRDMLKKLIQLYPCGYNWSA